MSDTLGSTQQENPVSIGDWILTWILLAIPVVNIIMLFVWALSSGSNKSKQNFARASFVIFIIFFVISLLMITVLGVAANDIPQEF